MSHRKEIVTAVGTLAMAVGIGFVMQSSEAAQERYGKSARATLGVGGAVSVNDILENVPTDRLIDVQAIELTSAGDVEPMPATVIDSVVQLAAAPTSEPLAPPTSSEAAPKVQECEMTSTASTLPGAMVTVSLNAPCAPNERLTVHHNGLIFTAVTDDAGGLSVVVPALAKEAVFILAFANGDGAVSQASVPDLAGYARVALQWRGNAGFELHAREFGADYGDQGHVWMGGQTDHDGMLAGENGYMMRLGNESLPDPLLAEVYTFAASMTVHEGVIDMTVEAEITPDNCGLEVEAQTLEMPRGANVVTRDLTLAVPDCDAVGDFLVLNNLVADMKVASN